MIDWTGDETYVLLNPRMPERDRVTLTAGLPPLRAHVWLASSGTSGALKLVALSKEALLASAAAVNRHLEAGRSDVWCCVLPTFHVGGLGIHARAFLSNSRVVSAGWNADELVPICEREGVTLSALVPAQVSDLVRAKRRAPRSLRAVVVGGGALPMELYEAARGHGWPLLPSYGMTECGSQVATAQHDAPELLILDHLEVRTAEDGRLAIRGASLLTGQALPGQGFRDPKVDGWLLTEDLGDTDGRVLRVRGRAGELVKIGGESVDLQRLDQIVFEVAGADAAVAAVPDERLGYVIHLAVAAGADADAVAAAFNGRVFPYERARRVHRVAAIPRTALGKLERKRLLELIGKGEGGR